MARKLLFLAAVAAGALAATGSALSSAPVPCAGTVQLTSTSNFQLGQAGSLVTGTLAGHLVQRTSADGDLTIRLDEVLSYGDGTLAYRGEASLANGNWQSHVRTVGAGTGPLAGIHGQGTFWFTGPASLADVIAYVYAP